MEAQHELNVIPGVCVKETLKFFFLFLFRRYPMHITINVNIILGRFLVRK
jgi:hypothetical protein